MNLICLGQNVQVFVRCRPLNNMEKNIKSYSVVELPTNKEVVVKGMPLNLYSKEFHYDRYLNVNVKLLGINMFFPSLKCSFLNLFKSKVKSQKSKIKNQLKKLK